MATLLNQGTLLFTPQGGTQGSVVSNTTGTELEVSYGLEVTHTASPATYTAGDAITFAVILRNTGSGTLILPQVTVDLGADALDYVQGSAAAFLYVNGTVSEYPFTVTEGSVIFSFSEPLPAGGVVFLTYTATVTGAAGDSITSTATATANEGVATGPEITDSDATTLVRVPISIVKSAPATARVGDTIQYRFTITNNTAAPVALDSLSDQLPAPFRLTGVGLIAGGTEIPLTEGSDYTVSADGLLTVTPAAPYTLGAGETVILTVTGVLGA